MAPISRHVDPTGAAPTVAAVGILSTSASCGVWSTTNPVAASSHSWMKAATLK
jgi:hypothetical protein